MTRKEELLKGANEAQRKVITSVYGKYYTLSTAGSGKTFSATHRTAYMIENGISAEHILMFTFTRKAADEMKERIVKLIGPAAKGMTIGTYHSFCGKLLRRYAKFVGLQPNYTVYDEEDSMAALKVVYDKNKEIFAGTDIKELRSAISSFKENLISDQEALKRKSNTFTRKAALAYHYYTEYLRKSNALDFDDMLYFTIKLLQNNKDIQAEVNKKYQFITADESQDSATQDLLLISLLAGPDPEKWNLMMFCDESQSIYSFRGANVSAFIKFLKDNKLTKLVMGQNYRSTKTIVNASAQMVKHNTVRIDKEIFTENPEGAEIQLYTLQSEEDEAKQIIRIINACVKQGYDYDDIAVLYRYRGQCQPFEKSFKKNNIPYKVLSGGSFFARKCVKDILAYVKLTVNPNDREAFRRVVNVPNRHVGATSLQNILDYINDNESVSIFKACESVKLRHRESRLGIQNFVNIVLQLCDVAYYIDENADGDTVTVANLIRETYRIIGYADYVKDHEKELGKLSDIESDISTLINIAREYNTIEEFLIATLDITDTSEEDGVVIPTVKLLTLHGSKGLEWPIVIIAGNNNLTIPAFQSVQEGNIEEERRLYFVGMTRAKTMLFLTRAKEIFINGRHMTTTENPFIREIPAKYIKRR